jgi:hypothetical protein
MQAESRVLPLVLGGLVLILFAALTVWFLQNFERRTELVDAGLSAEARRNGFLAAERFLGRLGIEAESVAGRELLRELPPKRDVLVVIGLDAINEPRREALYRWLSAGGRILVAPTRLWDEENEGNPQRAFLDRFGVQRRELEDRSPEDKVLATVEFEGYPEPLELEVEARYVLVDTHDLASGGVSADEYYRVLQYDLDDGQLTVISDMSPFTNRRIGERDHALFLALLAESDAQGKVWLLYDTDVPWLGAQLWRRAPYALIGAACLILALLWHLGGRLGPLLPDAESGRRDLLVHLQALAEFHWRHGRGGRLMQITRERIERAWTGRHPVLRGMSQEERAAWIAERAGIAPEQVRSALYSPTVRDPDLVVDSRLLQRLWTALSHARAERRRREKN